MVQWDGSICLLVYLVVRSTHICQPVRLFWLVRGSIRAPADANCRIFLLSFHPRVFMLLSCIGQRSLSNSGVLEGLLNLLDNLLCPLQQSQAAAQRRTEGEAGSGGAEQEWHGGLCRVVNVSTCFYETRGCVFQVFWISPWSAGWWCWCPDFWTM